MPSKPIQVPFPLSVLGLDNRHALSDAVFQPGGPQSPSPRWAGAVDVDIAADGAVTLRPQFSTRNAVAGVVGAWECGGREWVQVGAVLYEDVSGVLASRVTGLVRRVAMTQHGRRIFVTDGTAHWEIDGTTVRPWGLPVPIAVVAAGSGAAMAAGRYLVQIALVDEVGNSGGVSDLVAVTADGNTAYTASWAGAGDDESGWPIDTPATAIDIYASGPDQRETTWVARVPLDALPYSLPASPMTLADPPVTQQHSGPHAGLVGIASWRAWVLGWKDNALYRSEGLEPHLWFGDHFQQFRGAICGVVPVLSGIWVATTVGLWWLTGEDFASLVPSWRTSRPCLVGQGLVAGDWLPMLQTQGHVALFVDSDGVMACTEAGMVVPIAPGYQVPAGVRVSFGSQRTGALRQIFVGIHGS